ncbi:MAG: FapA family protein [Spirochaetes bacterium]|nr:FapA family protein [Spirochaetota bacterium]
MNELKKLIITSDFYQTLKDAPRRVELAAPSLEAGMERAAEYFKCPLEDIEYAVIENGADGLFGVGAKPYRIAFTYTPREQTFAVAARAEEQFIFGPMGKAAANIPEPKDRDGAAVVRVTRGGVMLKVTPAKGKGVPVNDPVVVQQMLLGKEIFEYDINMVNKLVKQAKSQWVKIAEWQPNIYNDGRATIDVSEDEMKVFVNVTAPQKNGREVDEQDIIDLLGGSGIVHGLDEGSIKEVVEKSITGRPFLIANGTPPVNGENARIEYKVDIEKKSVPKNIDENSNVDYKDLNIIENVTVGQVLAQKIEASDGVPGKTVKGKFIEAKKGKDIDFGDIAGTNVEISADRTKVISKINGQVVYKFNKLYVEPVFNVKGDVGPETGNITFLGNVFVGGNVLDNYKIQAAGNIDVKGSVGKAELMSEGDIMVKLGVQGKGGAKLKAGNDVIAKFIENANVEAGRDVVVTEAVMHSNLDAGRRVVIVGRRSVITGGRVRAMEEINAKVFGSATSAKTIVAAGIPPRVRQKLTDLTEEREMIQEGDLRGYYEAQWKAGIASLENERAGTIKLSEEKERFITSFHEKNAGKELTEEEQTSLQRHMQEMGGYKKRLNEIGDEIDKLKELIARWQVGGRNLPDLEATVKNLEMQTRGKKHDDEKMQLLEDQKQRLAEVQERLKAITKEIEEINTYLLGVQVNAKISAAKTVFPGVIVAVKSAELEVRDTFKAVTFYEENGVIQIEAYKGAPQQVKRAAL